MLVKDLLDPGMVTIKPTDTISDAWKNMKNAHVTGAVVVTDEGQIVGFLTDGDLVSTCMPSETDITIYDEIIDRMQLPPAYLRHLRSMKVEDTMQSAETVVTIDHNEPALKALALMFQHHLRRIPVMDGQSLIGTISRGQILTDILIDRVLQEA
jgi:DHA2 family lincomycin resistance protein-like MFS transporter